ncbi:MAG: hypothetical protein QJR02_11415 [Sinobacteraceae bacterium]|nr:hypothetical protein [Nevskiaceae bacterium]
MYRNLFVLYFLGALLMFTTGHPALGCLFMCVLGGVYFHSQREMKPESQKPSVVSEADKPSARPAQPGRAATLIEVPSEVSRVKELNAFYRNKVRTASVVDEPLTAAPSSLASKPFVDEDWNQDDPFREFGSLSMQWHTGVSS